MKHLKNIVLAFATLICMPLLSMRQPPQNWDRWILTVEVPENATNEQMRQKRDEVAQALGGDRLTGWLSARPLFNEIWVSIHETRPRIIELLQGQPWFNAGTLSMDRPLPAPRSPRPQVDVNR